MRISTPVAFVLGVVLSFAAVTKTAKADVIYTYTGDDFTSAEAPYSTSDFVSASFTFASPLPDNLGFTDGFPAIVSWSLTDQIFTLDPDNTILGRANFTTDAEGAITGWEIYAYNGSSAEIQTFDVPGGSIFDESQAFGAGIAQNLDAPGTWIQESGGASTPEPSTTVLMSLGGSVLVAMRRKHRIRLATQAYL